MNEELKARLSRAVDNLVKAANTRNEVEGCFDASRFRILLQTIVLQHCDN